MDKNGCLIVCDCYLHTWNWSDDRDYYICSECNQQASESGYNEEHGKTW